MFTRFASHLKKSPRLYTTMAAATTPVIVVHTLPSSHEPSKAHHKKGGGFVNPWESFDQQNMTPATMYQMYKDWKDHPLPTTEQLPKLTRPEFTAPTNVTDHEEWSRDLKATWLGHACFLVEFPKQPGDERGMRVLFDPVWSHRCSPSQWVGPARVVDPPIKLEEIPEIDAVVISHNHYDHLDIATLKHLYRAQPRGSIHFFAPLGNADWFRSNIGCREDQVSEMDWWQSKSVQLKHSIDGDGGGLKGELKVTCTPCQHFTGRGVFDRNDSLWASWSVESISNGGKVWFAGDTGYKSIPRGVPIEREHEYPHCPAFKEIGDREGPFDLSCIPIGAYDPRWFMSRVHCSPEDSVELHRETKSRRSLGMHHSTWRLTCEPMDEPPQRLRRACDKYGITPEEFGVSGLGETKRVKVFER